MKRILLPLILILFIGTLCAKKKDKPVLDGIFELRLGMTETQIKELVDTTILYEESNVIYDAKDDAILESIGVKTFYLREYEVDSGFVISNINFAFYQDTLYYMTIEDLNGKLGEMLNEKYGIHKKSEEDFESIEGEKLLTAIWNTNDPNIYCISQLTYVTRIYFQLTLIDLKIREKVNKAIEKKKEEEKRKEYQPLLDRL